MKVQELPADHGNAGHPDQEVAGAQDTIYLCNFRVSVDGEWLCLKELQDVEFNMQESINNKLISPQTLDMPSHLFGRDPVVIERSNLVNISKLVVKELIEQSLRYGRMLDSDHMPLQHFFIVLEHVLRHGLRPKKGLLGPKKELWDILQMVEKYSPEAQDITASVRDLPTVRTHMGRARAWLRIALMQKKLPDYLKVLIDNKDEILAEYFEPDALMMSDEAIIIIGLLVGLNVVDCNLCVKEEDLDCPQGVIDFSLYLRSPINTVANFDNGEHDHMTTVLDQKNYIEELNRHLNATVANLQAKVESLTTTNALMKEDLAIAKHNMLALFEENRQLKVELGRDPGGQSSLTLSGINQFISEREGCNIKEIKDPKITSNEEEELKQRLEEERKLRQEADQELEIQMCLKAETEVAMKLLEKDIHDKQDTIVSLRRQLDDIKLINLEMYKKLQEAEASVSHKTELVTKLEAKAQTLTDTIQTLEAKYRDCEQNRRNIEQIKKELDLQASQVEKQATDTEVDLKVERELRVSLQNSMMQDKERISKLQHENGQLKLVAEKYATLQEEHYVLKEQCLEQEKTLEEVGVQLKESKLQVSDLREEMNKCKLEGTWVSDKTATHCKACTKEFNLTRRKHHCRSCGEIFCSACSDNLMPLPSSAKPLRVCDSCNEKHLGRAGNGSSVM